MPIKPYCKLNCTFERHIPLSPNAKAPSSCSGVSNAGKKATTRIMDGRIQFQLSNARAWLYSSRHHETVSKIETRNRSH